MKFTGRESGMNLKKLFLTSLFVLVAPFAGAQDAGEGAAAADDLVVNEANSLDELLGNVQQRRVVESREHSAREQRFSREKICHLRARCGVFSRFFPRFPW